VLDQSEPGRGEVHALLRRARGGEPPGSDDTSRACLRAARGGDRVAVGVGPQRPVQRLSEPETLLGGLRRRHGGPRSLSRAVGNRPGAEHAQTWRAPAVGARNSVAHEHRPAALADLKAGRKLEALLWAREMRQWLSAEPGGVATIEQRAGCPRRVLPGDGIASIAALEPPII